MKTITVCKASPVVRDMPVESICLEISDDIQKHTDSLPNLTAVENLFISEADAIMEAIGTLPQGTRHKLLIMMLQEHQNLLIG